MNDRTESKLMETPREHLVGINLNFHDYTSNPRHRNLNNYNQGNQRNVPRPKFNSSWNSDSTSSDASSAKPMTPRVQKNKKQVYRNKKQGNWSASVVPVRNKCNDTNAVKKPVAGQDVQRLSYQSPICEAGLTAFLTSPSAQLENFKRLIQLKKKHYQKYFGGAYHDDTNECEISEDSNWGWFVDPRDSF